MVLLHIWLAAERKKKKDEKFSKTRGESILIREGHGRQVSGVELP